MPIGRTADLRRLRNAHRTRKEVYCGPPSPTTAHALTFDACGPLLSRVLEGRMGPIWQLTCFRADTALPAQVVTQRPADSGG